MIVFCSRRLEKSAIAHKIDQGAFEGQLEMTFANSNLILLEDLLFLVIATLFCVRKLCSRSVTTSQAISLAVNENDGTSAERVRTAYLSRTVSTAFPKPEGSYSAKLFNGLHFCRESL